MLTRKQKAVPKSRVARLTGLAGFAGKLASSVVLDGSKQLMSGERPDLAGLVLQPKHAERLVAQLSTMRGAAMKMGQMLSMDSGALLPPELAQAFTRLQAQGYAMPVAQLVDQLEKAWGDDWQNKLQRFSFEPIAAASIGQVHRGFHPNYGELAIKVQYPGVNQSIDSDINNLVSLLRMSKLVPADGVLDELVDEAKLQLRKEADYQQEAKHLADYHDLLMREFDRYAEVAMPKVISDLSCEHILAMEFVEGSEVETVATQGSAAVDRLMSLMFALFFCEFWRMNAVQTDPNLANFQYNADTEQLVLLDFGALRHFSPRFVEDYTQAIMAARDQKPQDLLIALEQLGFFETGKADGEISTEHKGVVVEIFMMAAEPLRHEGVYDFGQSDLSQRIREKALMSRINADNWHSPPVDVLFLHRKMAGLFMMAAKLKARVAVKDLFFQYLPTSKECTKG